MDLPWKNVFSGLLPRWMCEIHPVEMFHLVSVYEHEAQRRSTPGTRDLYRVKIIRVYKVTRGFITFKQHFSVQTSIFLLWLFHLFNLTLSTTANSLAVFLAFFFSQLLLDKVYRSYNDGFYWKIMSWEQHYTSTTSEQILDFPSISFRNLLTRLIKFCKTLEVRLLSGFDLHRLVLKEKSDSAKTDSMCSARLTLSCSYFIFLCCYFWMLIWACGGFHYTSCIIRVCISGIKEGLFFFFAWLETRSTGSKT